MNGQFEGLSLVELVELLEEVPEPPPIAMTPQTPGWAVVAVVAVAAALWLGLMLWRRWQAEAYRRAALAELGRAGDDAATVAGILRRTALVAFPRADIVPLTGDAWLEFLDRTCPGSEFVEGPGRAVATAPYRPAPATTPGLRAAAEHWVRRHKRPPAS